MKKEMVLKISLVLAVFFAQQVGFAAEVSVSGRAIKGEPPRGKCVLTPSLKGGISTNVPSGNSKLTDAVAKVCAQQFANAALGGNVKVNALCESGFNSLLGSLDGQCGTQGKAVFNDPGKLNITRLNFSATNWACICR